MDLLSISSAFATIVGLIGQFRSEKSGQEQLSLHDFMQWLIESNHQELKGLLEKNSRASEGIKTILQEDRKIFLEKIEVLNSALVSFASGIGGFSSLAEAINPEATLSKQAISILTQFENKQGSKAIEIHYYGGMDLCLIDGDGSNLEYDEPRFIEDDLKKLIELGLLRHDYDSQGNNLYIFTRAAYALVNAINTGI